MVCFFLGKPKKKEIFYDVITPPHVTKKGGGKKCHSRSWCHLFFPHGKGPRKKRAFRKTLTPPPLVQVV